MEARSFPIAVVAFFALLFWSEADASPLTYLSQTGGIGASAQHPRLDDSGDNHPISGLSDFDEVVEVSASSPPDGYEARAELATSLGATQLVLDGLTSVSVLGCDPFFEFDCFAQAAAPVTIVFDLSAPALTQMKHLRDGSTHNGPWSRLSHATLGFVMTVNYFGEWSMDECGSLDFEDCYALIEIVGPGAVLPAGEYELEFDLFAFTPVGSCNVGCNSAGGSIQLSVIPEPGSGALLSSGLVALGLSRRRREAPPRFPVGMSGRPGRLPLPAPLRSVLMGE